MQNHPQLEAPRLNGVVGNGRQVDSLPLSHQESPHITWIISEKINNPETLKP